MAVAGGRRGRSKERSWGYCETAAASFGTWGDGGGGGGGVMGDSSEVGKWLADLPSLFSFLLASV